MRLIVFTDLDGTLLDHDTYDFSPALPAIEALRAQGIPLILASSKTGAEIADIRCRIGVQDWPAIVENGAGELAPGSEPSLDFTHYRQLRAIVDQMPEALRARFRGFGDMSVDEIVDVTGLPPESAELARQRAYTEPGLFSGSEDEKKRFCALLEEQGVRSRDGGRFLTLSFGRTKADGLQRIARRFGAQHTIALGDAPNDRDMLLAASQAVVIRNEHAPEMGVIPGALYTQNSGPAAWNEVVLALLDSSA